ncbi:hypothetical protein PMAYCL1PPCAC_05330, partial [Pristionchus mayeri]
SQIYMLYSDTKVHFPTIKRSTLASTYVFACSGFCFFIYCITAVQICRKSLILLSNIPTIIYQVPEKCAYWTTTFNQAYWSLVAVPNDDVFMLVPWVNLIKTLSPQLLMLLTNTGMRRELR